MAKPSKCFSSSLLSRWTVFPNETFESWAVWKSVWLALSFTNELNFTQVDLSCCFFHHNKCYHIKSERNYFLQINDNLWRQWNFFLNICSYFVGCVMWLVVCNITICQYWISWIWTVQGLFNRTIYTYYFFTDFITDKFGDSLRSEHVRTEHEERASWGQIVMHVENQNFDLSYDMSCV